MVHHWSAPANRDFTIVYCLSVPRHLTKMTLLLMVLRITACGSKSMHCYCSLSPWESCNPGTRSSCNDRVPPGLASEGARVWGSLTSSPVQECAVQVLLPSLLPGGDLTNELCHLKNLEDLDTWIGQWQEWNKRKLSLWIERHQGQKADPLGYTQSGTAGRYSSLT